MSRWLRLLRTRAAGAMVAQVWQAVGSFGLQIGAAWLLGARGLGIFSLCFGIIVLATALTSGVVGDSLVILDRRRPAVRGALQLCALVLALASLVVATVVMPLTGLLDVREAVFLGLAIVAFQLEELVRRLLMAALRFWWLVVLDSSAVVVTFAVLAVWSTAAELDLTAFFVAIAAGQSAGIVVGVLLLAPEDRHLAPLRLSAVREVARFGLVRGLQISVPPLVLTSMRLVVTATAGAAALGGIELARIYVAPLLLAVQGFGSYQLSTYVRDRELPLASLLRRAWRSTRGLVGASLLVGVLLVLVAPAVATHVSGPKVGVDRVVLAGWVLYVAASASCQPFASLAATRGGQRRVLLCRCIDASLAIVALALLLGLGGMTALTPYVLAGGLALGGILVRRVALRPMARPRQVAEPQPEEACALS